MKVNIDISHLVTLARKNNRIAQRELFNVCHRELLGLCIRMVDQSDIAEDLLQESFVTAFTELKKLNEPEKFKGWLKRIVINKCISHNRKFRHLESIENVKIEDIKEEDSSWYKEYSIDSINKEIDRLPHGCRQIFILHLLEDYKHKNIAEMLNISVSTSKSQYQYALKVLRNKLKTNCYE